jgi:hypothetical protein
LLYVAYFSAEYLIYVKQMVSILDIPCVYFHRSRAFEMKDSSNMVKASRLLFGALKYRNEETRIVILQVVL